MTELDQRAREERRARQDVQALKELSVRIRSNASLADLFGTYLLTAMGRFRLGRAAVYVPTSTDGEYRLFTSKGHFFGQDLPETVKLPGAAPSDSFTFLSENSGVDPGQAFSKMGFTFLRILSWSDSADRHALVYFGAGRKLEFTAVDRTFMDLISARIAEVLAGHAGDVLRRIQDLERRTNLVRLQGREKSAGPRKRRDRETQLGVRNLQTLQDIAIRFKGGMSLPDLFNTYLLTLLGRLRLKRAAIYASTLPATTYNLFLWKGKCSKGALPESIDIEEVPDNSLWVHLKEHPALNRGNIFGRGGFSLVWILSTGELKATPTALIYLGADREITLSPADVKFIEILNDQMQGILNMLDSFGPADRATLLDWDKNIISFMQENLLDRAVTPKDGVDCRILFRPSHKVGGDFYDFYRLKDGKIGVALADVVGHGIPAALWTYAVRDQIRQLLDSKSTVDPGEPAEVLEELNRLLAKHNKSEMPVSVCYGVFDPASRSFTYSSAGIDYPLLISPSDRAVTELPAGGLFLGCLPDIRFSQETVVLRPDDSILIYTDGLQRAVDTGFRKKVAESFKSGKTSTLDELLHALMGCSEKDMQDDDRTALFLALSPRTDLPSSARRRFHIEIPSDVRHLPPLRIFLKNVIDRCVRHDPDGSIAFAVKFTAEDAAVNSIQHGYAGSDRGIVTVEAEADDPGSERRNLTVTVKDTGAGFEFHPSQIPKFVETGDLYRSNGRGLYMMFQMMDEVRINTKPRGGTVVELVKRLAVKQEDTSHGSTLR